VEFGILGPTSVTNDGIAIGLDRSESRVILSYLILHARSTTPLDRLVAEAGHAPRQSGSRSVTRAEVRELQAKLGTDVLTGGDDGFRLLVRDPRLDASQFRADLERARGALARADPTEATAHLSSALGRWRGPALADALPARWAVPVAERLESLRREAEEMLAELQPDAATAQDAAPSERAEARRFERFERSGLTRADRSLPEGVITFLMTDIVGSTRLWETAPSAMEDALARHDELMIESVESCDGVFVRAKGEGDSTFSVFRMASSGAVAALRAQRAFAAESWPPDCWIQVRMSLHTGEARVRDHDYLGVAPIRAQRVRTISGPGQILISSATYFILVDVLPQDASLVPMGTHQLKGMERPEDLYLLTDRDAALPGSVATLPTKFHFGWEVVVDSDLDYFRAYDHDEDVQFPAVKRRRIALTGPRLEIGRRRSADIDLVGPTEDGSVSKHHAVLERQRDGRYAIHDTGSSNGTFVNDYADFDDRIEPYVPTPLDDGDRVYLGDWTCLEIRRSRRSPTDHR
jgi:class 3 adenylate cyclase